MTLTHNSVDETNLLNINKLAKPLNKPINKKSHKLAECKKKYVLSKTKMALFRPKRKSMDLNIKLKLNRKRFYRTNSVKYLGVSVDNKVTLKCK